jgi:ferrous iron transport protein B
MDRAATSVKTQRGTESLLLVGNPNVGKSVIFGALTGRYVTVSNYPGTTIEVTRGRSQRADMPRDVIDTPGTNHLFPMSEDERVTRDILLEEPDATVVQVGDAKNLKRVLSLTLDIARLDRPAVLVLNMMDEARDLGVRIDRAKLERRLGIPVIESVAIRKQGLSRIAEAVQRAAIPRSDVRYPSVIAEALARCSALLAPHEPWADFVSMLFLSGDPTIIPRIRERVPPAVIEGCEKIRADAKRAAGESISTIIQRCNLDAIDAILEECYISATRARGGWTHRFGRWSTHPLKGIGVLAAVLAITFWFVGLLGAGTFVDLLENGLFGQVVSPTAIHAADAILPFPHAHTQADVAVDLRIPLTPAKGISTGLQWSRHTITPEYHMTATRELTTWEKILRLIHDLLVGPYGVITMAIAYGFAIVLPIVATFFLLFSVLEDSGYLPRLAVMVNDIFRAMGLNGRAVLPMVLGLGCDTMATLTTRILETRKQRLIVTLLLALGVPCSAQLGVLLAMMSVVSPAGTLIWLGVVAVVMIVVGWLAARAIPGRSSDFLLELPPVRRPVLGNIAIKTMARIEWYLREVLPLFVLGTLILFVLDRTGVLPHVRNAAAPLIKGWLGLPPQTADAFLIGFLRRDYGAVFLLQAATGAHPILDGNQTLVSMVVITLFVPCVANVFIIVKEHGIRTAAAMTAFIFPFAFFVGGILMRLLNLTGIRV